MTHAPVPVIIGVGEVLDRPNNPAEGLEPLALMEVALGRAEADSGAKALALIDGIDVINVMSWRYRDLPRRLVDRLGIAPRRQAYADVGGETPVSFLHAAALRIARGESTVTALVGAEAHSSVARAQRTGVALPWTSWQADPSLSWAPAASDGSLPFRADSFLHPLAAQLDVTRPTNVYPFYDAASASHWGQTPRQALAESGALWAEYARVAGTNPYAWLKQSHTPADIITPTEDNRLIAWPYTKRMVANPTVNQGAAVLVTSLEWARAAGVREDRLIYVWDGAGASDRRDYLDRDQYFQSHAQEAVLGAALKIVDGERFDALELYSCFPCVPKMARRALGLGPDIEPTVTGGLSFFGAPLNNYMTHAICAMVRRLRTEGGRGLLYGQGEFVTKHHALVLGSTPAPKRLAPPDGGAQIEADRRRGVVPRFVEAATGQATVETFTVLYDRAGLPDHGVVILRLPDGSRTMARVPAEDTETIARLTDLDRTPIGEVGILTLRGDGISDWRAR